MNKGHRQGRTPIGQTCLQHEVLIFWRLPPTRTSQRGMEQVNPSVTRTKESQSAEAVACIPTHLPRLRSYFDDPTGSRGGCKAISEKEGDNRWRGALRNMVAVDLVNITFPFSPRPPSSRERRPSTAGHVKCSHT